MSNWISVEDDLPCVNTKVDCAYDSDDGEGNFKYDFGECAMDANGLFWGVGLFYSPQNGKGVNGLSIKLAKKKVRFWMERKQLEQPTL